MRASHRAHREWTLAKLTAWGERIGAACAALVLRAPTGGSIYAQVRAAFAKAFPQLAAATPVIAPPYNKPDH